jgi:hypothetical protein
MERAEKKYKYMNKCQVAWSTNEALDGRKYPQMGRKTA